MVFDIDESVVYDFDVWSGSAQLQDGPQDPEYFFYVSCFEEHVFLVVEDGDGFDIVL